MAPNAQKYYPVFDKDVPPSMQGHLLDTFTALNDHDAAIVALNAKIQGIVAGNGTTTIIQNVTTGDGTSGLSGLGKVNAQTTDYTLQSSDAGSLVTMTSGIATTIVLNFNVTTPFFVFIENFGSAVTQLIPNNGATINGVASLNLQPNFYAVVFFDVQNWEAATLPSTTLQLETGGTPNSTQSLLNLSAGANITLTEVAGTVTVAATGTLSFVRVPHVVTGTRTLATTYQNTTGVEMWVSGYCNTNGGSTSALQAAIGTASPSQVVWAEDFTATLAAGRAAFTFLVPDTYYYSLSIIGGTGGAITGVGLWVEFY